MSAEFVMRRQGSSRAAAAAAAAAAALCSIRGREAAGRTLLSTRRWTEQSLPPSHGLVS